MSYSGALISPEENPTEREGYPFLTNQPERRLRRFGQMVRKRDLGQVTHHDKPGHKPLPMN
jgi:hypothetical protein